MAPSYQQTYLLASDSSSLVCLGLAIAPSRPNLSADEYSVNHYINKFTPHAHNTATRTRNRRFRYMTELLRGSEFFSDSAMQQRAPALYRHFVESWAPSSSRATCQRGDTCGTNQVRRILYPSWIICLRCAVRRLDLLSRALSSPCASCPSSPTPLCQAWNARGWRRRPTAL